MKEIQYRTKSSFTMIMSLIGLLVKYLGASIESVPVDGTKIIITMKVHEMVK